MSQKRNTNLNSITHNFKSKNYELNSFFLQIHSLKIKLVKTFLIIAYTNVLGGNTLFNIFVPRSKVCLIVALSGDEIAQYTTLMSVNDL